MTILVLAEHDGTSLLPATSRTVSAAAKLGGDVEVLVAGASVATIAEAAAKLSGVKRVRVADAEHYAHLLAEEIAPLIAREAEGCSHVLAAATTFGKDVLPRAAALLDVQQISDVTDIISPDTFRRPIYAGNAFETVQSSDACKLLTVRPTRFDAVGEQPAAETASVPATDVVGISTFVSDQGVESSRPDLGTARVVISGGRGLGSKENFALIEKLADALDGAIGASRAAVDAGYAPNDWQVGQTGKVVAPELYIAVGISGAIQHLAGMKDSRVIVAINKDENAPIFDIADYGLVMDLFTAVPELTEALGGS